MDSLDPSSLRCGFAGSKADDDTRRRHSALPAGRDVEGRLPGTEEDMRELMTREIAEGLPGLYEQDGAEDPMVYVHYFSCVNGWDWWLLEFDGTDEAFGLVEGYDDELGYFSLKEMAELNRSMGFAVVERDEHFSPKPLSAVRRR